MGKEQQELKLRGGKITEFVEEATTWLHACRQKEAGDGVVYSWNGGQSQSTEGFISHAKMFSTKSYRKPQKGAW